MDKPDRLEIIARLAKAAKYGERDAKRHIAEAKRRAAMRVCSPEGLRALFPATKGKA